MTIDIVGIITAALGIAAAIYAIWKASHAARQEEVEALAKALVALRNEYEEVQKDYQALKAAFASLRVKYDQLERKYFDLCDWCKEQGLTPPK
jgi:uncharacterized protein HemX